MKASVFFLFDRFVFQNQGFIFINKSNRHKEKVIAEKMLFKINYWVFIIGRGRMAQWIRRRTSDPKIAGSNPATISTDLYSQILLLFS